MQGGVSRHHDHGPRVCSFNINGVYAGGLCGGNGWATTHYGLTVEQGTWNQTVTDGFFSCGNGCPIGWTAIHTQCFAQHLKGAGPSCNNEGNPCNVATGNKYHSENDFAGGDGVPAFARHYNSQANNGVGLGTGWTSIHHATLSVSGSKVTRREGSGRAEPFTCPASGECTGDADTTIRLTKDATGYTLDDRNGGSERYSTAGALISRTDNAGRTSTYSYNGAGRLIGVQGPFGHTLTLGWPASGPLVSIITPAGQQTSINYLTSGGVNRPSRVDYPDGSATLYHYENANYPAHLTGISYVEPNGATTRYATYTYGSTGRATATEHAGGAHKLTFAYSANTYTTVKDAIDTTRVLTFTTILDVKRLTSKVHQIDGKSLKQTFDARGNLTCKQDEEGRVTTYTYNTTNQKLSETQGLTGTCAAPVTGSATRTTTYQYLSATRDLPTTIGAPSVYAGQTKTTTIAYGSGALANLPTQITQAGYTPSGSAVSRTVTLAYNSAGQVTSINGPRTDVNDITQ
jgi:YD repeat-containing protein